VVLTKDPFAGVFFLVCQRIYMNYIVLVLVLVIFFSLGSALIGLLRGGKEGSDKMFKALRMRISLSVFLFILLMFASLMGWIETNNILPTH